MHCRTLRAPSARQAGCYGTRGVAWGLRSLAPAQRARYKLADRPECSSFDGEETCSTSERSQTPCQGSGGAGDVFATRIALERLYLAPLDWSRSFSLVTLDGECLGGGARVLAAQQQQQQQGAPPPPDAREKSPDYYANVGDAIRTLREDIPLLFDRELNFSIYRDDIVFRDPRNSFSGMNNYKTIFWSLRFHGRIFFKRLYVDVKRIWQTEDGCIRMRWTVHGIPRVPWEAEGTFDGISQYKLDREGKIYEHAVDNVILRDPPVGVVPWLYAINLRPAQQQAVPGAFFQPGEAATAAAACEGMEPVTADQQHLGQQLQQQQQPTGRRQQQLRQQACDKSSRSSTAHSWWAALLTRFSWVRFYAALIATMQLLQQHHEQLQLRSAPQQACADR